jgi:hypothetical protein
MDGSEHLVRAKSWAGICTRGMGRLAWPVLPPVLSLHHHPHAFGARGRLGPYLLCSAACMHILHVDALMHRLTQRSLPISREQMHERTQATRFIQHTIIHQWQIAAAVQWRPTQQNSQYGKETPRPSVRSCCLSNVTDTPHMSDWPPISPRSLVA